MLSLLKIYLEKYLNLNEINHSLTYQRKYPLLLSGHSISHFKISILHSPIHLLLILLPYHQINLLIFKLPFLFLGEKQKMYLFQNPAHSRILQLQYTHKDYLLSKLRILNIL